MAQPSRYQYQPVTGPVWRAPVAESLSWLPDGNWQPLRQLLVALKIGSYALEPIFQSPPSYDPVGMQWLYYQPPSWRREVRQAGVTVLNPLGAYNPAGIQWLYYAPPVWRTLDRAKPSIVVTSPLTLTSILFRKTLSMLQTGVGKRQSRLT